MTRICAAATRTRWQSLQTFLAKLPAISYPLAESQSQFPAGSIRDAWLRQYEMERLTTAYGRPTHCGRIPMATALIRLRPGSQDRWRRRAVCRLLNLRSGRIYLTAWSRSYLRLKDS